MTTKDDDFADALDMDATLLGEFLTRVTDHKRLNSKSLDKILPAVVTAVLENIFKRNTPGLKTSIFFYMSLPTEKNKNKNWKTNTDFSTLM